MLEFEINMSEMPLGKLSKENIQKGMYYIHQLFKLDCSIIGEYSYKQIIYDNNLFCLL